MHTSRIERTIDRVIFSRTVIVALLNDNDDNDDVAFADYERKLYFVYTSFSDESGLNSVQRDSIMKLFRVWFGPKIEQSVTSLILMKTIVDEKSNRLVLLYKR